MPSGDGDACYFPRDLGRGSYGGDVHCLQRFLSRKGYLNEEPTGYFGDRTAIATKRWQVRARALDDSNARSRSAARKTPARKVGRARHAETPRVGRMSNSTLSFSIAPRGRTLSRRSRLKVKLTKNRLLRLLLLLRQRDNGIDSVDGHLELASRDKYAALHNLPLPGSGRVTPDAGADQKNTCVDVCAEFTGIRDCQTRCARDARDKKHACREACQTAFGSACDRAFPASGEGGSTNFKICLSYMSASCEDTCGKFRS